MILMLTMMSVRYRGDFRVGPVLVLSRGRAILRSISWALLAAALAGIVQNEVTGTRYVLAAWFEELGLPLAEGVWSGLAGPIAGWPAWPVMLVASIVLLAATRSRNGRRMAQAGDTPVVPTPPVSAVAQSAQPAVQPGRELRAVLRSYSGAFAGVAVFSGVSNVLMLTGSFFMLEIYDRVLPSRSLATLMAIAMLAAVLFVAQGLLDLTRGRVLARIGAGLDAALSARLYDSVVRLPLRTAVRSDGLQPFRDLDTLRAFLSGSGPSALFDLPWMPLYLAIIFAFHPVLGLTALVGVIFLVGVTLLTEVMSTGPTRAATEHGMMRNTLGEASRRNAEVLAAMGMSVPMRLRWEETNRRLVDAQQRASDVTSGFGSLSRAFRMMLQSAVLAVGAYLVIRGEASAGIIIAGSILSSRALAPVELTIGNWRGFIAARQSWQRLGHLFRALPAETARMALPAPRESLTVQGLGGGAPGEQRLIVQEVSFALKAGAGLAVMGPSASGKSTLARMLVGVWQPARGSVRLDGAGLDQWSGHSLGPHIGYLPQDVELFAGSIAQNIARFDPEAAAELIVAAARAAGVHDMIVNLAEGYETLIGERGRALSAGQQQRVALARALYGDPFLVVLDEPNSNLDAEGDAALTQAVLGVRQRGGIVVVVAHRPSAIAGLNLVLALHQGRQQIFGPKEEVLAKILRPAVAPVPMAATARPAQSDQARS